MLQPLSMEILEEIGRADLEDFVDYVCLPLFKIAVSLVIANVLGGF